jgi:hypothetical protein
MKKSFYFKSFILVLMVACFSRVGRAQPAIKLKLLGQVVIPNNYTYKGTPVGGLSGLAYDGKSNQFYVISDDRSQKSDARFYTIKVHLGPNDSLKKGGIHFTGVSILKTPKMHPYKKGTIDAEGIAIGSDQFVYVSSEGAPKKGIAPFINGYGKDGSFARNLTIPKAFWNPQNHQRLKWGVCPNLAFESLTTTPNQETLITAIENALYQDGPAADSVHSSPARIIVYDLPSGDVLHEYQYNVDSIFVELSPHGSFAVNGLSDLEALDNDGHMLGIERNFVIGQGLHIKLYEISIDNATDIQGVSSIKNYKKPIQPVHKKLVARMRDFDIDIDNFEGLALGPKLSDGGRLLLIVSDNNFLPVQQTLFTAFSLYMK